MIKKTGLVLSDSAILALADGSIFRGRSVGAPGAAVGEVVFNTAMTGYQEILTDPSYARQLVTLTYPHIGNTGVTDEDEESAAVHAAGLIIRDLPVVHSSWRAQRSLSDYLTDKRVVAISDIDTRRLTRLIREKGAQAGCIATGIVEPAEVVVRAQQFSGLQGMDLAQIVSCAEAYEWRDAPWRETAPPPRFHVVAFDFGIKRNILRLLVAHECRVTVVPARTNAADVLALSPDGVFLSNGPGDPEPCDYAIEAIREILVAGIPVFGICLGHQLLALASGAKTIKMKFGHHGANHPVQDLATGQVMITSQNHGFAVDEATLPDCVVATHRSLFDGSLQGIARNDCQAFGFQGHPEASPGPHELRQLFDRFGQMMSGTGKPCANVMRG
ncbi:MAG: glutamine-hydrolyzing carbamoyl-phosphate synthase small subunit [Gammaproteobacteria bacterium]|nr:glutamine-hydrolyzing carbamoyl-phosphate synthase small subunit [Gammaproteobacteria bacterium]